MKHYWVFLELNVVKIVIRNSRWLPHWILSGKSIKSLPTSLIETKLYKLTFIICGLKIKNDHRNRTRILRHDLMVKNVLWFFSELTEVFERKLGRNVPCMVLLKMHVTTGQNFNARPYGKMFFKFSLLKLLSHLKVYLVDMSGLLSYTMFYHVFIDQKLKMSTIKEKKSFQWENVKIYNLHRNYIDWTQIVYTCV